MNTVQDKTSYWKQVGLVLMGAILGSAPLQISTYMQGKSQKQEILFNQRMDVLKAYSLSVNEELTAIIPQLNKVDSELMDLEDQLRSERKNPGGSLEKENVLREDLVLLDKQLNVLEAQTNMQEVVISVLFHYNFPQQLPLAQLPPKHLLSLLELSSTPVTVENPPVALEKIRELRNFVAELRKGQVMRLQVQQESIRQLTQKIGNP